MSASQQLELIPEAPKADYRKRYMGLPLRQVHGQWTAAAHVFGEDMVCKYCYTSFDQHQATPAECQIQDPDRRAEIEAAQHVDETKLAAAGAYVNYKRRRAQLTVKQLSAKARMSINTISRVCQGRQSLTPKQAKRLAPILRAKAERMLMAWRGEGE